MRGLTTLYLYACEEQGCESNSALVRYFHELDMIDPSTNDVHAACPTTLDLSQNYLGDAGTAACFRVLTLMRWVRRVNARNVGAGPRAVRALCELLTTAFPLARQQSLEDKGSGSHAEHTHAITADRVTHDTAASPYDPAYKDSYALIALEEVDLRDSDVYAESGQRLVRALQQRQRLAARWQRGNAAPGAAEEGSVPETTLVVHVDLDKLPHTTAASLAALNAASDAVRARHAEQRRRRAAAERLRLFCTPAGRPMGEQLVFRLPLYHDVACSTDHEQGTRNADDNNSTALYDCTNATLVTLVTGLNRVMEEYLAAYGAFTALQTRNTCHALPHRAAAQLGLELGPDILPLLARTDAKVWCSMKYDVGQKAASAGRASDAKEEHEDKVTASQAMNKNNNNSAQEKRCRACGWAVARAAVAALLRGFCANPFLAEELSRSRGAITQHYLDRLRELYYTLPERDAQVTADDSNTAAAAAAVAAPMDTRMEEMMALYQRLVAALVTQPMSDLPSMSAVEERLRAIRAEMMSPLLAAKELHAHTAQKRLRMAPYDEMYRGSPPAHDTTANVSKGSSGSSSSTAVKEPGSWSLWCSQLKYLRYNHAEEVQEWNAAYSLTSGATPCDVADDDEDEASCEAFATCTCVQQQQQRHTDDALPRPCPACCHAALRALLAVLNDAHAVQRLALLAPLRAALPRELRYFFLDLVIRHCSNECVSPAATRSACVYVPALFGQRGSLALADTITTTNNNSKGDEGEGSMLSLVDCLAAVDGQPGRMSELLSAFEEWYRLRMLESMDATGAMSLFSAPAGLSHDDVQ